MLNSITYSLPPELDSEVRSEMEKWASAGTVARIWKKDASVWTGEDEAGWLGWLDIAERELNEIEKYRALREDIVSAGFSDILLMGMGGSSLCPEVLAKTFGVGNFHILDSTVPAQVISVANSLDVEKTLFIVASKSGTTLEPNCFKQYFFDEVAKKVGVENAGRQFIAITDPGSKMEEAARADGFRHIIYGDPEVGGRFSALSAFGMTAASVMGISVEQILKRAVEMAEQCRADDPVANPGALLGVILGVCHRNGRDKLTIFTSPEIYDVGAWLEQLIAESTGKNGVAIIPIDREPLLTPDHYGDDRVFVNLTLKGSRLDDEEFYKLSEIEKAGHPYINIEVETIYHLGQEFFRWEFATAVAGAIMNINPFNQPDVEAAKIEAKKITEEYERTGELPEEAAFYEDDHVKLFSGEQYAAELAGLVEERNLEHFMEAHFWGIGDHDYFAVLAYVEMNDTHEGLLQELRSEVLLHSGAATCLGFGPRFLHSTGQAYKGGPNTGVFLQITADDAADLPVPGQKYTFGVVKAAQARGDFQVLVDRERRALRIHLGTDVEAGLRHVLGVLQGIDSEDELSRCYS